jgi:hypothetical protein
MVSEKRPLCWWCESRPKTSEAAECLKYIDWQETAAMMRRECKGFSLDFGRIGDVRETEPWYRVKKSEQLSIDFSQTGGGGR